MESRGSLASLSGVRIASITIVADGPELPRVAEPFARLHTSSREATIRRQLLFAAGDSVDTLLVGETMRRLRRQRLFSDAVIQASRCDGGDAALVLRTRDYWTLRPRAQLRTNSVLSLGIEERNLAGTGRSAALLSEWTTRGGGAAFTLTDPWLLGSDVAAHLRVASLGGSRTLRASVRNHEYSVYDPWRVEANLARLRFADTGSADRALHSLSATLLGARRVGGGNRSVTMIAAGLEFDSATTISPTRREVVPGTPHARSFLGIDIGVSRRTAVFDTVSWVVPGRGFLDVGLGWEGDVVAGVGRERILGVPAVKVDAWAGRIWIPKPGRVLLIDAWTSGYLGRLLDANHIQRVAAAWFEEAPHGFWGARFTAERLLEVDPDLRQLSLIGAADYSAPALRPHARLAGRAIAGSVERARHLRRFGPSSVLDAGAFLATSYRWQVADRADGQLRAGVVGARLRLLTANGTIRSVRLDAGYPVLLSAPLERRPFALVTVGTLFDVARQRDGRRLY